MPGPNIDVLNNPPSIADLTANGMDAVRLVSKPDPDGPGVHPLVEQYLADLKAANIFALVIVDSSTGGRLPANNHGWFQFGNEPDVDGPASWTMDPDTYVEQFNTYSQTFPQFNWIAAGLAAGDYSASYWSAVCPRLVNCVGFAVHPYLKDPDAAVALVQSHQQVDPSKLAFVTEFNCGADALVDMLVKLHSATAGQYWYAAGDWMNPGNTGNGTGFGLLDHPDKLAAWNQAIQIIRTPPPPVPEYWVDLANFQKNLTPAMVDDMLAYGVAGVISQAITGLDGNSYTNQQLSYAGERGLRQAGYVWCFPGVSVASRLHMFDPFEPEFLALDNEQSGLTISAIQRDFALCDSYMGKLTEDYTARWYFAQMGWLNLTLWANRPLWYALYDQEHDLNDFVTFGGWTRPRMHQFWDHQLFGGVECDISVRFP